MTAWALAFEYAMIRPAGEAQTCVEVSVTWTPNILRRSVACSASSRSAADSLRRSAFRMYRPSTGIRMCISVGNCGVSHSKGRIVSGMPWGRGCSIDCRKKRAA